MKILWVKAGGLVPPDTGGKIRSYNILRELARTHAITFFSFYAAHQPDIHDELRAVFRELICLPLVLPRPRGAREMLQYSASVFSRQPYNITKYCRREVSDRLRKLLRTNHYDVIVCDFLVAAGVVPWDHPVPKVLFTHNVETTIWRRHFEVATNPLWKVVSWLEWKKMDAAEHRYLRLADHVLTVSETDAEAFARFLPRDKLTVVPTGVDLDYFRPAPGKEDADSIVFTGSMDWMPNQDGIAFFAESVFPLILQKRPGARLCVVGRNPSRRLQEMAQRLPGIQLTGWVEDVRPFLERGSVCVVPLRIGGGTRLKIFEAMAMAKAVVSTTIGAEGLPVRHGENILLGDTPEDFAGHVLALLQNAERRLHIGQAAHKLVADSYSWHGVAEGFSRTLESVVKAHSIRRPIC
jgi:sugar transferase (PEP-CTERM/EpsH1 system associated)